MLRPGLCWTFAAAVDPFMWDFGGAERLVGGHGDGSPAEMPSRRLRNRSAYPTEATE